MNSTINFSYCSLHNDHGIMFDRDQASPEKKINCARCLAEKFQNLILIEDIQNYKKELIQKLVQEKIEQNQNTISILQEIVSIQDQIKNNIISLINKNILNLNRELETIQKGTILISNLNLEVQNNGSFEQILTEVQQQTQKSLQIKSILSQQLNKLDLEQIQLSIFEKISKIQTEHSYQIRELFYNLDQLFNKQLNKQDLKCQQHDQKGVMIDLNKNTSIKGRIACLDCIKAQTIAFTKLEDFMQLCQNQQQEKQQLIEKYKTDYINKTSNSIKLVNNYNISFQNQLCNVLMVLKTQQEEYEKQLEYQNSIYMKDFQNLSQKEIIELADELSNQINLNEYQNWMNQQNELEIRKFQESLNQVYINQLQQIIEFYKQIYETQMCNKNYDLDRILSKKKLEICQSIIQLQIQYKSKNCNTVPQQCKNIQQKMEYKQISTIKQDQWCFAISFYYDTSQMVVGSNNQIKVYNNQNDIFTLCQIINQGHKQNVQCLKYMNRSKRFVSGGQDKLIIIWSLDDKQQYFCEQQLNGHSYGVTCLEFNKFENLLISGSTDEKVRFWILQNQWELSQSQIVHKKQVEALSLSQNQQLLISCCKQIILVHQLIDHDNLRLQEIQKIETQSQFPIYRINFINNNTFVFQSSKQKLSLFIQQNDSLNFIEGEQIEIINTENCYQYSPSIYLNDKGILIFKSGQNVYILKKMNDQKFFIQQNIQFQGFNTFVAISQNAQYLSIWNKEQKEIQIRKLI